MRSIGSDSDRPVRAASAERAAEEAGHAFSGARRALTVLELVLVLAVLAVVAMIAVPRCADASSRYRANLAAKRVQADLCYMRGAARTVNRALTVVFQTATDSYQMVGMDGPLGTSGRYQVFLSDPPYRACLVAVDLGATNQVTFDGWGRPDCAGKIVVRAGDETREIIIEASTGEVTIQ